jgi:uncharacterized membrane protein
MEIITHRKHNVNISQVERVVSAVGGGILAITGLQKRSPGGIAMALIGGDLLRRAITGHSFAYEALGMRTAPLGQGAGTTSVPYELGLRVDQAITIGCPRAEAFRYWRQLSNLANFMEHVQSVRDIDGRRSHWVVKGPAGRMVEWDAVIHNEIENELIAWRSLPGADVDNAGSVTFKEAPGGRGTEIRVELQYNPPAGVAGAAFAALWGEEPSIQIHEDLHRLQHILEAGESLTTKGQPSGRDSREHQQPRHRAEQDVQHASEASFPASDAPAYHP